MKVLNKFTERLNKFEIRVGYDIRTDGSIGRNVCHYFDGTFGSGSQDFSCPSMPGCFLTIQRVAQIPNDLDAELTVCEVIVTGAGEVYF